MSSITVASIERIAAPELAKLLLAQRSSLSSSASSSSAPDADAGSSVAVVDVRDVDHVGGHIKSSLHYPYDKIDALMPTLRRKLADKQTVVFHCALSQQRGPSVALRYLREKEGAASSANAGAAAAAATEQKVYILSEGFEGWRQKYGTDERLTEGYVKELFESGV